MSGTFDYDEDLVLLKVEPTSHPLYFVIRQRRLPQPSGSPFTPQESDKYFFEEHTCPTNWTGDIECVIAKGDPDPHGFATFVRRIPAPAAMEDCDDYQYLTLFPEAANAG